MGTDKSGDREGSGKDLTVIIYKTLFSSDKGGDRNVFNLIKDRKRFNQIFSTLWLDVSVIIFLWHSNTIVYAFLSSVEHRIY